MRKLKKTARKSAIQPKRRTRRKRFITRAEARRRAERHVSRSMFKAVRDGADDGPDIYGVRREDTWIFYKNQQYGGLQSSEVVVICKRPGRVLYDGPTYDEG
jgi:hypothetical protein